MSISAFPKRKEAGWFLIIANPETNEVMGLKRLTFKRFTSKNLIVLLPDDFESESKIKVYLMCDSYIGLDQEYTIDINRVNDTILSKAAEERATKPKTKKGKSSQDQV